jgi:hypothetical protein
MADIDQSGVALGEAPRIEAFKGEQAVTSALMDLVEGKKNILGYLIGHREPQLQDPSPVSVLKTFIENENVKFQELNLFELVEIPADIKAILVAGPQYDFSDREMKLIRDFWNRQGRILFLRDPSAKTPKMDAFVAEQGVRCNDDRLLVFIKTGLQEIALTRDVQAKFLEDSPITQRLANARALFFGGSSSLSLDMARTRTSNIHLQPLLEAEKGYFAESDYTSTDQTKLQADAARGSTGPLILASSIEKGGSADARVQVNSARMVVVGNAGFIEDKALTQDQQGLDFVSGCLDWLLSREQLIGIAPKVPQTLTFTLSDEALSSVRWIILVFLPLFPAIIGTAVWWKRRA